MIKVAITDDHMLILEGIQTMLGGLKEIKIVGTYTSAEDTLSKILNDAPEVLLLDINLPDINGIILTKQLLKLHPELKIIGLSNYDETSFVKRILNNGAKGYLLKNSSKDELLRAIRAVNMGEQYLHQEILQKLVNRSLGMKASSSIQPNLTRREKEVLVCISKELTTNEIAERLFISPKTVETHRMNLISKLGAKNSVGLIKIALENNLLEPED